MALLQFREVHDWLSMPIESTDKSVQTRNLDHPFDVHEIIEDMCGKRFKFVDKWHEYVDVHHILIQLTIGVKLKLTDTKGLDLQKRLKKIMATPDPE